MSTAPSIPAGASDAIRALLSDFGDGRKAALARAVSIVENHRIGSDVLMAAFHPSIGRARRVGITGPPGAGKSTLTNLLAEQYLEAGHKVGIVAVDPTSPFTGGALLGDRVRMEMRGPDGSPLFGAIAQTVERYDRQPARLDAR